MAVAVVLKLEVPPQCDAPDDKVSEIVFVFLKLKFSFFLAS